MDLKCAVCFLTLAVGISAYSSSSDASPDNLAGSCVGSCLEDQSDPQLMLVQRQAIRTTEGNAFEKVEDQTLGEPEVGAHHFAVACAAHPKCAHLHGDCCPTMTGVMLGCCDKQPPKEEEGGAEEAEEAEEGEGDFSWRRRRSGPTCGKPEPICKEAVNWAYKIGKVKAPDWYSEKLTRIAGIHGGSPSEIVESASKDDFRRLFYCQEMERNVGKCNVPPCSCTNPPCDHCPTESPTETPTPERTETPTPEETSYETPTLEPTAGAVGDPHVTNIRGEKFNVFKTGHMEFLRVPLKSAYKDANLTLLGIVQDVVGTSDECKQQRYITSVLFGGAWIRDHKLNVSIVDGELVTRLGTSRVDASDHAIPIGDLLHLHVHDKEQLQLRAGEMAIGVSAAGNHNGKHFFLNLEAKSLAALNERIGGLLGEDSHDDVSTRPLGCLRNLMMKNADAISFATAES